MQFTLMTAVLFTMINFISPAQIEAAKDDDELSIMAAEQRRDNQADVTVREDIETFDDKPTAIEDKNSNKDDDNNHNTNEDSSVNKPDNNDNKNINTTIPQPAKDNKENITIDVPKNPDSTIEITNRPRDTINVSSQVKNYSNFEEAAKKVGYVPLYIPKKSGFSMNYIAVVNEKIVEIHYGRRWEPTVTLSVRTYKRAPDEKLQDISGLSGVKWKTDLSSGSTIYIARVSDNTNAAAWSVGQYTFAAMTENLSFAAFHSLIIEELFDLCNHYFVNVN